MMPSRWFLLILALLTGSGGVVEADKSVPSKTETDKAETEVCRVRFLSASKAKVTICRTLEDGHRDSFKLSLSKEAQQELRQTAVVFVGSDHSRRRLPASIQITDSSNVQEPRDIVVYSPDNNAKGLAYELEFETGEISIALKYLAEIEEFGQPRVTPQITITNGSRLKLSSSVAISGFGVPVEFRDGQKDIFSPGAIGGRTTTVVSGTARPAEVSYAATLNSAALKTKGKAVVAQSQLTVKTWPDAFKRSDTTGPIDFLQRFQSYGDVEVPVAASDYEDTISGKEAVELDDLKDTSHQSSLLWISGAFTTDRDKIALSEGIVTYHDRRLTGFTSHVEAITELKYTPVAGLKVVSHKVSNEAVSVPITPTSSSPVIEIAPPSTVVLHQPSVASIVDQLKRQQAFLEGLLTVQPERYAKSDGSTVAGLCTAKDVTIDTRVFLEELAKQRSLAASARSKVISNQPIEAVVDNVDAAQLGRQLDFWDGQLQALEELETGVVRECNERIRASETIDLKLARKELKRIENAVSKQASP